ncbi:MAG: hypothetical protein COB37_03195 [Kordiimonadales bacterium]|nr:MAG: hypothetical protein COB37_03195 [Kordiimonadales bacterium]
MKTTPLNQPATTETAAEAATELGPFDKHIALKILIHRMHCGMSQAELALAAGIPIAALIAYEQTETRIPPALLIPIAEALGTQLKTLLAAHGNTAGAADVKSLQRYTAATLMDGIMTLPPAEQAKYQNLLKALSDSKTSP